MRVLVVCDNALNREILIDQLSASAVRVDQAQTGSEALAALRAAALCGDPYRRAIIDNSLPDMSGIELSHAIKSVPAHADLQLVLLTPFGQDARRVRGQSGQVPDKAHPTVGIVELSHLRQCRGCHDDAGRWRDVDAKKPGHQRGTCAVGRGHILVTLKVCVDMPGEHGMHGRDCNRRLTRA